MGKSSMGLYRSNKEDWGVVEGLYDNSKGSCLLADARAGMLDTNVHRRHFEDIDTTCGLCGGGEETIEHVVVGCAELGVRHIELRDALGLGDSINWEMIRETKQRLSWWKHKKKC